MATVVQGLSLDSAKFQTSGFPQVIPVQGTNFPIVGALGFDATAVESCYWRIYPVNYGSGSVTVTVEWYADTATSGAVTFRANFAAITPNVDTQNVETKALGSDNSASDTNLTNAQQAHSFDIVASNVDSMADGDWVWLRLQRVPTDGGDTMIGDAIVTGVMISYSDT